MKKKKRKSRIKRRTTVPLEIILAETNIPEASDISALRFVLKRSRSDIFTFIPPTLKDSSEEAAEDVFFTDLFFATAGKHRKKSSLHLTLPACASFPSRTQRHHRRPFWLFQFLMAERKG